MKYGWLILAAVGILLLAGGTAMGGTNAAARIADAIAYAEGFYVSDSRPQRNNNPGDLTRALGYPSLGMDGIYVIFQTVQDGWNALRKQVQMMLDNTSTVYNSSMTIYEVAQRYTVTDQLAWATNVAQRLGVNTNTKISEV